MLHARIFKTIDNNIKNARWIEKKKQNGIKKKYA